MTELGESFRDYREHQRGKKAKHDAKVLKNMSAMLSELTAAGISHRLLTESPPAYRLTLAPGVLCDWWPTTGMFREVKGAWKGYTSGVKGIIEKAKEVKEASK